LTMFPDARAIVTGTEDDVGPGRGCRSRPLRRQLSLPGSARINVSHRGPVAIVDARRMRATVNLGATINTRSWRSLLHRRLGALFGSSERTQSRRPRGGRARRDTVEAQKRKPSSPRGGGDRHRPSSKIAVGARGAVERSRYGETKDPAGGRAGAPHSKHLKLKKASLNEAISDGGSSMSAPRPPRKTRSERPRRLDENPGPATTARRKEEGPSAQQKAEKRPRAPEPHRPSREAPGGRRLDERATQKIEGAPPRRRHRRPAFEEAAGRRHSKVRRGPEVKEGGKTVVPQPESQSAEQAAPERVHSSPKVSRHKSAESVFCLSRSLAGCGLEGGKEIAECGYDGRILFLGS